MPSIILQSPSKFEVRQYLQERQKSKEPPPSRERVREMLGFPMLEDEREHLTNDLQPTREHHDRR